MWENFKRRESVEQCQWAMAINRYAKIVTSAYFYIFQYWSLWLIVGHVKDRTGLDCKFLMCCLYYRNLWEVRFGIRGKSWDYGLSRAKVAFSQRFLSSENTLWRKLFLYYNSVYNNNKTAVNLIISNPSIYNI